MKIQRLFIPMFNTFVSIEGLEGTEEDIRKLFAPYATKEQPRLDCEFVIKCTDYPDRCVNCANNKAKSYFSPKS